MKKILSYIIFLIGICSTSQAFPIKLGPRLGISTSRLVLDANTIHKYRTESGFGYQVGAVGRVNIPFVYIQPEILFTGSGATYYSNNDSHILRYLKLNIPIIVGIKLMEIVRLQAGPTFNFLLRAQEGGNDMLVNYKSFGAGYQVGIGLDFGSVILDLKYEGNLSKFGEKLAKVSIPVDHRESLFILSVGINLLPL